MAGNHRSGRRPKPTAVKRAAGNPGRRKLGVEPEYAPLTEATPPPKWLGEHGGQEWRRVLPQLVRAKSLTLADVPALEGYCAAYDLAIRCEREITTLLVDGLHGVPVKHPLLPVRDQAWTKVLKFAADFGLTPATRPKVAQLPAEGTQDALAAFASEKD